MLKLKVILSLILVQTAVGAKENAVKTDIISIISSVLRIYLLQIPHPFDSTQS